MMVKALLFLKFVADHITFFPNETLEYNRVNLSLIDKRKFIQRPRKVVGQINLREFRGEFDTPISSM